ncbi:helix-turn-helix transcriptional regulator [Bermanella sp. 47_1433_sub80_T6]|nr:helix-turn-helix transcriptional regulator [Bermanella sp. 47_1433_sub80_T6]
MLNRSMQKKIASLIDHIRLRSFPNALADFLAGLCHFDSIIMVTYKESFKPVMVFPMDKAQQSQALKLYLEKSYILDPLYNVIKSGNPPEVCRLNDIAPDSFESTEYYQTCYKDFNFADEINMIIQLDNQIGFAITIGRNDNLSSITRAELNRLNDIFPVINSLVRQFWLSQSQEYVKYEKSEGPMQQALSTFGSGILTPREQEISALILQGHSSKAIANQLNISLGTVKVHRKNIHTRLNTSTQSEIFTLFLLHLSELETAAANVGQPQEQPAP